MQTEPAAATELLEIACDESGSEGENLIGGNTDVFAHASVQLSAGSAAECIQEIRDRIRSPATEYKANHLLREKHRLVLKWLLGPSAPIHGHAHVHLTDKTFFVVGRVVDLLLGEASDSGIVRTLYRDGEPTFGRERWRAFLVASNSLMRRSRPSVDEPVDPFFHVVDVLRFGNPHNSIDGLLERLAAARPRAESFRARLLDDPTTVPPLDPLLPAIVQTVVYWSDGGKPISVVHDYHSVLTGGRVALLKETLQGRLAGLTLVDSRSDSRVQLADFLAGIARKIASDELNRRGDPAFTALLRPYVDASSTWGDDRSWSSLRPTPPA